MVRIVRPRAFPGWRRGLFILILVGVAVVLGAWGYLIKGREGEAKERSTSACESAATFFDLSDRPVATLWPALRDSLLPCASYVAYSTLQLFTLGASESSRKVPGIEASPQQLSSSAANAAKPAAETKTEARTEAQSDEPIWQLHIARIILGVLAVYGAVTVLVSVSRRVRWIVPILIVKTMSNHHLVIGLGVKGTQYIFSRALEKGPRVVGVDLVIRPDVQWLESIGSNRWLPWPIALCWKRRVVLVEGDARNPDVLTGCRIHAAHSVTIVCASDSENLEIARSIEQLFNPTAAGIPQRSAPRRRLKMPLQINVHIENRSLRKDLGHAGTASSRYCFRYFSVHQLAARLFWQKYKLPYEADIRGHRRLHVVLIGFGDMAEEMMTLVAILWPYRRMSKPLVTIVSDTPKDTTRRVQGRYPQLQAALDWRVLPQPLMHGEIEPSMLQSIERHPQSPSDEPDAALYRAPDVSAVFICTTDDMLNIAMAKRFQAVSRTTGRCRAPIYPHVWAKVDFARSSAPCLYEARFSRVIQEFGLLSEVCGPRGMEVEVDELAAVLQATYLERVEQQLAQGTYTAYARALSRRPENLAKLETLQGAALLPFTDAFDKQRDEEREMNRMPALHFAIKVLALGYAFPLAYEYDFCWPVRLPDLDEEADSDERAPRNAASDRTDRDKLRRRFGASRLEALANTEHRRWMNEKSITGWRLGSPRNDERLVHPSLKLLDVDDPEFEKDEDQILAAFLPDEVLPQQLRTDEWQAVMSVLGRKTAEVLLQERWTAIVGEADPDPVSLDRIGREEFDWQVERMISELRSGHPTQTVIALRLQCGEETVLVHRLFERLREMPENGEDAPLVRCFVVEAIPRSVRVRRYARRCAEQVLACDTPARLDWFCQKNPQPSNVNQPELPRWISWLDEVQVQSDADGPADETAKELSELTQYLEALNEYRARLDSNESSAATGDATHARSNDALRSALRASKKLDADLLRLAGREVDEGKVWKRLVDLWRDDLTDKWTKKAMTFYERGAAPFIKPSPTMPSLDWVIELYDERYDREWQDENFGETASAYVVEKRYLDEKCLLPPTGVRKTFTPPKPKHAVGSTKDRPSESQ